MQRLRKARGPGGYTYGDFGKVAGFPEVHADGEIWLETLWQIRQTLGASVAETLVTRAMELSPPAPSYLDMRNAIIQADLVNFGGANETALWSIFAERGMGYFAASTSDDVNPIEDFSTPAGLRHVGLRNALRHGQGQGDRQGGRRSDGRRARVGLGIRLGPRRHDRRSGTLLDPQRAVPHVPPVLR